MTKPGNTPTSISKLSSLWKRVPPWAVLLLIAIAITIPSYENYAKSKRCNSLAKGKMDQRYTVITRTKRRLLTGQETKGETYESYYSFEVNGRIYRGSSNKKPTSQSIDIYYNPDNPEENIAERNNSPMLVIFGCFLSVVSLFGLIDTGRKIYSHTASNNSPPPIPNDDDNLENPLDRHVEIQVTEHQIESQETIQIKLPFQESTFSFQLKPEMRNKKVRLQGVLSKGAGHLFVQICVVDGRSVNFDSLHSQLQELVKIAWSTEEAFQYPQFLLSPNDLAQIVAPDKVIEVLLRHVERVTPGFNVPYLVPQVIIAPVPSAVGQFEVDEEGWVTIKVGVEFFADRLAAQAILAHEVCHYILENSGIRKSNVLINERYTDLCMFVCGFGQIFLAGYKRESAQPEYRPGHRLGYLTDAEYEAAQKYIMQLRQSAELAPSSKLANLKKQLEQLVYDAETCKRIIQAAREKYPHKSEIDLYQDEIDRLIQDRGQ